MGRGGLEHVLVKLIVMYVNVSLRIRMRSFPPERTGVDRPGMSGFMSLLKTLVAYTHTYTHICIYRHIEDPALTSMVFHLFSSNSIGYGSS